MIVAFTGKKFSGKDTASRGLPSTFIPLSFADPLREVCRTVFGVTAEQMSDPELKEAPLTTWPYKSPRALMQEVGTDLFRERFPGVWIEAFKRRVAAIKKIVGHDDVRATDLRFLDEARAVRELGGIIIRVVKPDLESADPHVSETEMDRIVADATVVNSGTVEDLQHQVALIHHSLRGEA